VQKAPELTIQRPHIQDVPIEDMASHHDCN